MKFFIILSLLISFHSFAGVYTNNQWQNYEVTTCFAQGEAGDRQTDGYVLKVRNWKEKNKEKVKNWVNEEYTNERTGIHFTGFLDCDETPNAQVVIFHNKNSKVGTFLLGGIHGLALVGPYYGSVEGYPAASAFVSISSSGVDKGTVIHEFGHSAGLHHEHIHYDAYKAEKGKCDSVSLENKFTTQWNFTEYDSESVMNYCRLHRAGGSKVGLSPKDVQLLRKLYP